MKKIISRKALLFCFAVLLPFASADAFGQTQTRPLLQEIKIHRDEPAVQPSPTPLVRRTGSVDIVSGSTASGRAIRTSIPILAETAIPGVSGILVESMEGHIVVESGSDIPLNPASNVKVATTYAVLKTFGPDFRFQTHIYTDGVFVPETATLHGNLYVSGRDPIFANEHAIFIANELNRMGIRTIEGDLVITDNFAMNHNGSPARAAQLLFNVLDGTKRTAAANRAWANYRIHSGRGNQLTEIPSIRFSGGVFVQERPDNAKILFTHESSPMREIIKVMMNYSSNFVSERLGDMLGGPFGVARLVQQNAGVTPQEFSIQTSSGLGINRVTASAMMKLLRVLQRDLKQWDMTFADVMPVAGMDTGTLVGRFATDFSRGSVVGKTGTLNNTDAGVSALSGEINTRSGKFLFVIFNQRGSVPRFRSFQNEYISLIQGQFGGAAPINYSTSASETRLAQNRISYEHTRQRILQ